MKIELTFQEINSWPEESDAGRINAAANFIMENFFPEFDEADILPDYNNARIDTFRQTVTLQINPTWIVH